MALLFVVSYNPEALPKSVSTDLLLKRLHSLTWLGDCEQESRQTGQLQPRQRKVPLTRRKQPRQRGFEELSGPEPE